MTVLTVKLFICHCLSLSSSSLAYLRLVIGFEDYVPQTLSCFCHAFVTLVCVSLLQSSRLGKVYLRVECFVF